MEGRDIVLLGSSALRCNPLRSVLSMLGIAMAATTATTATTIMTSTSENPPAPCIRDGILVNDKSDLPCLVNVPSDSLIALSDPSTSPAYRPSIARSALHDGDDAFGGIRKE